MPFVDESVAPLLDPTADPTAWAEAMQTILMSELWANTWSSDAGSACRVVFLFNNGLRLSWFGDGCGSEPEGLQIWVDPIAGAGWYTPTEDGSAPMACPLEDPENPDGFWWSTDTQTWTADTTAEFTAQMVTQAVAKFGPCTLALPWETFTSGGGAVEEAAYGMPDGVPFRDILAGMSDEDIEQITSQFEDECIEVEGPILLAAARDAITLPAVWGEGMTMAMGDSWLPFNSPNSRFMAMVQHISEQPDWVVDWDECCGTCAGSTISMLAQEKGMTRETAKAFVLFGQNAQYAWRPDGTVDYEVYVANDAEAAELAEFAEQFHVSCDVSSDSVRFH